MDKDKKPKFDKETTTQIDEQMVRDIIREELSFFFKHEKYTVNRPMEFGQGGKITGLQNFDFGALNVTATTIGLYGETPTAQGSAVSDPSGGLTVDSEARTAINALIDRLQAIGIIA